MGHRSIRIFSKLNSAKDEKQKTNRERGRGRGRGE
jgi:hypothetical protein